MRAIIVARRKVAAKMNEACAQEDTQSGWDTFTIQLAVEADPTVPVAYWCSWDFAATKHDPSRLRQWMRDKGATDAETSRVPKNVRRQDLRQQRIAFFDADEWTPDEVLDALGLVRLQPDDTDEAAPDA